MMETRIRNRVGRTMFQGPNGAVASSRRAGSTEGREHARGGWDTGASASSPSRILPGAGRAGWGWEDDPGGPVGGLAPRPPDLTIVLDLAPELARARVGPARDRIEDRSGPYHDRVRDGYLEAARVGRGQETLAQHSQETLAQRGRELPASAYPAPIVLIDASADPQTVCERIQSEVERVLALDPRP
jgi:thymidylate kinase